MIRQCRLAPTRARGPLAVCVCACCDRAIALQRARGAGAARGRRGQRVLGACAAQRARVFDALRVWRAVASRGMRESRATRVRARETHSDARLRGACGWAPRAIQGRATADPITRAPFVGRGACCVRAHITSRAWRHRNARATGATGPCQARCVPRAIARLDVWVCYVRGDAGRGHSPPDHTHHALVRHHPPQRRARAVVSLRDAMVQGWGEEGGEGARAMRVCVCAVTHRHQQQIGL